MMAEKGRSVCVAVGPGGGTVGDLPGRQQGGQQDRFLGKDDQMPDGKTLWQNFLELQPLMLATPLLAGSPVWNSGKLAADQSGSGQEADSGHRWP